MVINFKLKSLDGAAVGQGTGIANVGPGNIYYANNIFP